MENYEEINEMLISKLEQELKEFKEQLKTKHPEEIMQNSYKLVCMQSIIDGMNGKNCTETELKALVNHDNLLEEFYDDWLGSDGGLQDALEYSIDNIKRRIIEEQSVRVPFIEYYKFKKPRIYQKYCKRNYKKSNKKLSSLAKLYYHYCYLLKVYPNNPKPRARAISSKIKQEVKKMNNYSKQAIFLDKNNINSLEELEQFKITKVERLEDLIFERKRLEQECIDNINLRKLGILISLYTGIRIGEICALKWKDIIAVFIAKYSVGNSYGTPKY